MQKLFIFFSLIILTYQTAFATNALEMPIIEVDVPIIMYHLVTERPKYVGKYGITPDQLEQDLIYLKENGYTTVVMQDLINFVEHGKTLPQKPIVLTFDDGNSSDYNYLFPLLQKHKMKAVLAIIGEVTDRYTTDAEKTPSAKFPNMTWPQVKELHESDFFEIQSHGYDVHGKRGSGNKKGESAEVYYSRLTADLKKLQDACQENLGYTPNTFVYPLGIVGKNSKEIITDMGFVASLGCEEGVNVLRFGDSDSLFKMYRYNRPSNKCIATILESLSLCPSTSQPQS